MKALIINADDVGLSKEINEAARKCYLEKVITGVSLLACGESFSDAASMLHGVGRTNVGAHLVLTGDFKPCTSDLSRIRTLVPGGRFPAGYKAFAARYLLGAVSADEVYEETTAQVKKIKEAGLQVTHIDSHEHVHMFPEILRTVIAVALDNGIPYVRLPRESSKVVITAFSPKDLLRHAGLKVFASHARRAMNALEVYHNDYFWGHFHAGRLDNGILSFIVNNLGEGINELAVHPGVLTPELEERSSWHRNSQKELTALIGGSWRRSLADSGVRTISHLETMHI
ncbi:MAG: ChbG/HpnK family deacetylase [Candidatus Omnitrophica bacterium]|nr:ChbG/HpnK family deacetylase [Candidatus Omnitrophota bacterium]